MSSLEQALKEMEKEIGSTVESELKNALSGRDWKKQSSEFNSAIEKLQDAIQAKGRKIDDDADDRLSALNELLAKQDELKPNLKKAIMKLIDDQQMNESKKAKYAYQKAKDLKDRQRRKIEVQRELAEAKKMEADKKAEFMKKDLTDRASTLEKYYSELASETKKLKAKEMQIEAMRREIQALRKEVDRIRKNKND